MFCTAAAVSGVPCLLEESLWKLLVELHEALESKMFFQDKLIKDGNMQTTVCYYCITEYAKPDFTLGGWVPLI